MKKWFLALVLILLSGLAAYFVYQNRPEKKYARHIIKARLYAKENNFQAAHQEYVRAFEHKGGFVPYANLEVMHLENAWRKQLGKPDEALENTRRFLDAYPDNLGGLMAYGELGFDLGRTELALPALQAILDIDSLHFSARLLLAQIRTHQGRLDLASEQLRQLRHSYPDSLAVLLPLAYNLLLRGQVQEARHLLRDLSHQPLSASRARLYLVDSYLLEGNVDSAQAALDVWKVEDTAFTLPVDVRKARLFALAGEPKKAVAALKPHLQPRRESPHALAEIAILHAMQGRIDSALVAYDKMGERDPSLLAESDLNRMLLFLSQGSPAQALKILGSLEFRGVDSKSLVNLRIAAQMAMDDLESAEQTAASADDPISARFLLQYLRPPALVSKWAKVQFFERNKQTLGVAKAMADLLLRHPENEIVKGLVASDHLRNGRWREASRFLASLKNPSLPQKVDLVEVHLKLGDLRHALTGAERLVEEYPSQPGLSLLLADISHRAGFPDKAIKNWKRELEIQPGNLICLNNLAWELGVRQGRLREAAIYHEALRKQAFADPRIYDTLGWLSALMGNTQEAEEFLRRALTLTPDQPSVLYRLARVRLLAGDSQAARSVLEAAFATPWDFPEKVQARSLRDSLHAL